MPFPPRPSLPTRPPSKAHQVRSPRAAWEHPIGWFRPHPTDDPAAMQGMASDRRPRSDADRVAGVSGRSERSPLLTSANPSSRPHSRAPTGRSGVEATEKDAVHTSLDGRGNILPLASPRHPLPPARRPLRPDRGVRCAMAARALPVFGQAMCLLASAMCRPPIPPKPPLDHTTFAQPKCRWDARLRSALSNPSNAEVHLPHLLLQDQSFAVLSRASPDES